MNYEHDLLDELFEKLVAQLQRIRCKLRVKTQPDNNFFGVARNLTNFKQKLP